MTWIRSPLWILGILFGFGIARALDAAWVMAWWVEGRPLVLGFQIALDVAAMAAVGMAGGLLARWLAGRTAGGVGMGLAVLILAATAVDLLIGVANAPAWHELVTALVMAPAAALAGGGLRSRR